MALFTRKLPIYDNFMKILKGKILAIKDQVKFKPDQVISNQTVLKSVIETIIFCGRQALSLHGYKDDPQFYNSSLLEFPSVNVGNFLELIRFFRIDSRVFSILADEVRDCSNTEQMSFVI